MDQVESNLENLVNQPYKYGFITEIETETIKKGLNEDIIHLISKKKEEPKFMLDFRLNAFNKWKKMSEPDWGLFRLPKTRLSRYSILLSTKKKEKINSLQEVDQNYFVHLKN